MVFGKGNVLEIQKNISKKEGKYLSPNSTVS